MALTYLICLIYGAPLLAVLLRLAHLLDPDA